MADEINAYAAGLFDGEGHVQIRVEKNLTFRFSLSVTNTDLRPLGWLREHFKGTIHIRDAEPRWENARPLGRWNVYGTNAEAFARAIIPFTIIKTEQLLLFLEARQLVQPGRRGFVTPEEIERRREFEKRLLRLRGGE